MPTNFLPTRVLNADRVSEPRTALIPGPSPEGRREFEPLSLRERGGGEGDLGNAIFGTGH